jgi:hypothetical protein
MWSEAMGLVAEKRKATPVEEVCIRLTIDHEFNPKAACELDK